MKGRLPLLVLARLRGAMVLYYGDEIGMTDVGVPLGLRQEKMTRGGTGWQGNRDRARTPMRWDASVTAGFTAAAVAPWLPVGDNAAVNVAGPRGCPASVLGLSPDLLSLPRAASRARLARLPAPPAPARRRGRGGRADAPGAPDLGRAGRWGPPGVADGGRRPPCLPRGARGGHKFPRPRRRVLGRIQWGDHGPRAGGFRPPRGDRAGHQ